VWDNSNDEGETMTDGGKTIPVTYILLDEIAALPANFFHDRAPRIVLGERDAVTMKSILDVEVLPAHYKVSMKLPVEDKCPGLRDNVISKIGHPRRDRKLIKAKRKNRG